jgi:hypothetical protein
LRGAFTFFAFFADLSDHLGAYFIGVGLALESCKATRQKLLCLLCGPKKLEGKSPPFLV